MGNIALAKDIKIIPGKKDNQARIEIGPLFTGYGVTLGNAIRRVLLSSLPGAAPVGLKIKGANHEFMPISHIKEDVLEIILNLKKLRLKSFSDELVKLELDVHGKKKITAADITKNSEVEIVNNDLYICEITDMAGNISMEILIDKGMGYHTIESRKDMDKKNKEVDYIEMDSIFTPVLNVGINIESVRVGKMTNWDKLIIDIETDGTISPKEAYEESVQILIEQFGVVAKIGGNKKESSETETEVVEDESEEEEVKEGEEEEKKAPKKKPGRPKKEDIK